MTTPCPTPLPTITVTPQDRDLLRSLAARVRQIADDPSMPGRKKRWYQHNALQPQGPMILCYPEGCWTELLPEKTCQCQDPQLREWEWNLRSQIYWWEHIHDDNALEPYFNVSWKFDLGTFGVKIPYHYGDNRGSYTWEPPLKDLSQDLALLKHRQPAVDRQKMQRDLDITHSIFGDILPPRTRSINWWTVGLTMDAAFLMGMEGLMLAMYDQPEQLHQLMAFLRDDLTNIITWAEKQGLLTPENENDNIGSGSVGYTDQLPSCPTPGQNHLTLRQQWGFAESQETVGVGPDQFAEFILPYQVQMLDHFGLNHYGCCEPLELRIDHVIAHIPRLRRVSVAPSANQAIMAEKLGKKYIFSRKPYPAHVCVGFNEPAIREDLRQTLEVAGDLCLEIILKDTHTVEKDPQRITRWIQIAYEEVDRYRNRHS